MATAQSTSATEPKPVPDRVAIETPRGDIRCGDVVDVWMQAQANAIERWYLVEVDGSRYRRPAGEVGHPRE
jgi:hypothetical protein